MQYSSAVRYIFFSKKSALRLSSHYSNCGQYYCKLGNEKKHNLNLLEQIRSVSNESHGNSEHQFIKLDITLPDLSEKEAEYVRKQVDVTLNPNFLKSELVNESEGSTKEGSTLDADINDPNFLKRIFPINSKKGAFHNVNICTKILRKEGFPSFAIPNPLAKEFRRKFNYPLVAERTAAALSTWGVTDDDLKQDPTLVIDPFSDIVKYGKASELFNLPILEAKALYNKGKKQQALRGLFIRNKTRMLENSLENLGFSDIANNLSKHAADKFAQLPHTNIDEVDAICAVLIIEELINQAGFTSEDIDTIFKRNTKNSLPTLIGASDAQAVARNYFIFKHIMDMKRVGNSTMSEKYLVKSCLKSCPLETLILLNSYWKTIHRNDEIVSKRRDKNDDIESSKFFEKLSKSNGFKKLINFPSYGFPVSLKQMYFSSMGFDSCEIKHLLLSDESLEFKSIDSDGGVLHYTQSNYVPTMKKRLLILRENGTKLGLLTPSDYFKAMKNWKGIVTSIGDKAKENNDSQSQQLSSKSSKHNAASAAIVGDVVHDVLKTTDSCSANNILTYLQEYFGGKESQKQLARDLFQLPAYSRFTVTNNGNAKNINNLKSYHICQTLHWLQNQGFNKGQIRKALPLIFYHPAILEQKLLEIKEMEEFQPWSEQPEALNITSNEDNRILEVLLYLVEKEFSFSDEGTYFAQGYDKATSLNYFFSESFCNEIMEYTGTKVIPEKRSISNIEEAEYILKDINDDIPELKLGMINFQDFIYLYNPTAQGINGRQSSKSDISTPNSISHCRSELLKNDSVMQTAYRQFCSLNQDHKAVTNDGRSMSSNAPKDRPYKSFIKIPRLFHITNPITWFEMKLKYLGLQNTLDPNFREEEFIRGAKQAVSTITQMISSNQFDDMQGMLTQRELQRIKSDIETKWSDRWRNNINVNVDEIEWVNTSSIQRYNIGRSDYVDIALIMRAVKDIPLAEEKTIGVLIEIKAEFSKDYGENSFGDWCITKFIVNNMQELNSL